MNHTENVVVHELIDTEDLQAIYLSVKLVYWCLLANTNTKIKLLRFSIVKMGMCLR